MRANIITIYIIMKIIINIVNRQIDFCIKEYHAVKEESSQLPKAIDLVNNS